MKNFTKTIFLMFAVSFSSSIFAGSIKTNNPERKRSNSEAMSEVTYKKFVKLQEMIADEKYVEARAGFERLMLKRLNHFEKANVNQYIGWIDSAEGKYVDAAKRFKIALDSDALPNRAHFSMMLQMAQLYMTGDKYQKGIDTINEYYKITDEIKDSTFALEANAYAQLNNFKKAIPVLKKAISVADKPKEQWNYLLYSLHMELSQFKEAAVVLELLIKINPNKKDYWKRLYGVYFNLKKDDKALAILAVANKNGLLDDEKDRVLLFNMYALLGVPYEAGKIMDEGLSSGVIKPTFKRWDDLGKVWYTASEMDNALVAFGQASKLATDGKIDFQRANIYFERQEWKKASSALAEALEKGGLNDRKTGNAWLLIGMAESEQGKQKTAIKALKNATKYKSSRNNAVQWIKHLENKIKKDKARAERERMLVAEDE